MNLNWLQSGLYGFISGFLDILPVSAPAHKVLLLKFLGGYTGTETMDFLIHLGIFAGLYYSCQSQIIRINRARALARIPKRRRRRPLDIRSLMDWSMLKTMLIPVVLGLFLYQYGVKLNGNLMLIAIFLLVNGVVLYIPQFFPSSNRDSRTLSRVEGLLVGLGATVSVLPGMSAVGAAISIGSLCGIDRTYSLTMALMMNMGLNLGLAVYDLLGLFSYGWGTLSFLIVVRYLLTAAIAFGGSLLGVKLMRYLAANHGYAVFAFYCSGLALFTFILNLVA